MVAGLLKPCLDELSELRTQSAADKEKLSFLDCSVRRLAAELDTSQAHV
jgi:hypothetical protein